MESILELWENLETIRKLSSFLQWFSISLVFLGGVLMVARFFVDRQEKCLTKLGASIVEADASVQLIVSGILTARAQIHRHDEDKIYIHGTNEILLVMSSKQVRATPIDSDRVLIEGDFEMFPIDRPVNKPMSILQKANDVVIQIGFFKDFLMKLPQEKREFYGGKLTCRFNNSTRTEIAIHSYEITKDYNLIIPIEKGMLLEIK